jgi:hypothetical protein
MIDEMPRGYKKDKRIPHRAQIQNRQTEAIALKMQGFSLLQIGLRLHADPSMNVNGSGFTGGYGWKNYADGKPPVQGEALQQAVSKDVAAALRTARLASESVRQEALQLTLDRLETAAAALWRKVLQGDARAQEVWLRNIEHQMDLLGIRQAPDQNILLTVEGVQPAYDEQYAARMFAALEQVGAITGPGQADLPLPASEVIEAEVIEVQLSQNDDR